MAATQTPATLSIAPTTTLSDLRTIVDALRLEHPNAGPRLDHAAFIATFREVERGTSAGLWWVQSETDPNQTYMVTAGERCCCQDFARRGELTWCKHLLSVAIVERAERLTADREQAADAGLAATLGYDPDQDIMDVDQPIAFELSPEAYELLDQLGEVPDLEPQRPVGTCTRQPMSATARAIVAELFGSDPDAA